MWTEHGNALIRRYRFPDFKTAFAFMADVAEVAEAQNHHPWWANEYDTVEFRLRSHDAGNTVTKRDHRLAERIEELASRHGATVV